MILNHGILFIEKETKHLNIIEGIILGSVKEKKKRKSILEFTFHN